QARDQPSVTYNMTGDLVNGRYWTHFRCAAVVTDGIVTYEATQTIARSGSPPVVESINIVATTQVAVCQVLGVSDPDGPDIDRYSQDYDYRFNGGVDERLSQGWFANTLRPPTAPLRRGETAECRYRVTDQSGETTLTDWVSTIVTSTPPSVQTPSVLANDFNFCDANKTFFCAFAEPSDYDNDIVSSDLTWMVNGVDQGISTRAAELSNLRDGDEVSCQLVVSDPDNTITRVSAPITIVQPPSMPIDPPVVTPPGIGFCATSGTYTCAWTPSGVDVCGAPLANPSYRWLVDGQDTGVTTSTYEANGLAANAEVTCEVTVADRDRPLVESATYTVNGTPPALEPAVVTGPPPEGCQAMATYTCSWEPSQSSCGDALTIDGYTWTINDLPQAETGAELTVSALQSNSTIRCEVTVNDPSGPIVTRGSLLVTEAAPTINSAPVIDPAVATVGEILTCEVGTALTACGDEVEATYQWLVDGVPLEGATEPTLSTLGLPDRATLACFATWASATGGVATAQSAEVQLNPGNYAIESAIAGDLFGYGVAVVGDLNRDGLD
ncbi:MAG: hypothetical protein AAFS10_26530, partial [Myxococcota bacterium]